MVNKAPCIKFHTQFDGSKLTTVKLERTLADGTTAKETLPVTRGKSIEEVLYVEEGLMEAATTSFELTRNAGNGRHFFLYFSKVLKDTARTHWTNIVTGITLNQRNWVRFTECIQELYRKFVTRDARDVGFTHLDTIRFEDVKMNVNEFVARSETLHRYYNKLPGSLPERDDNLKKQKLYEAFHNRWQEDFALNRGNVNANTLDELVEFMKTKEDFKTANQEEREEKRKRDRSESTQKNKKHKNLGPDEPCPIHKGHHVWKKCSLNPNSINYKNRGGSYGGYNQYGGRGGRSGGRGDFHGGRGGPGRGNGGRGGRFYGGTGRSSQFQRRGGYSGPTHQQQSGNNPAGNNPGAENYHNHQHHVPDGGQAYYGNGEAYHGGPAHSQHRAPPSSHHFDNMGGGDGSNPSGYGRW